MSSVFVCICYMFPMFIYTEIGTNKQRHSDGCRVTTPENDQLVDWWFVISLYYMTKDTILYDNETKVTWDE